jgi:hypothetical protein
LNTESSSGISPQFFHFLLVIEKNRRVEQPNMEGSLGFGL